jgi:hypothetical protein
VGWENEENKERNEMANKIGSNRERHRMKECIDKRDSRLVENLD